MNNRRLKIPFIAFAIFLFLLRGLWAENLGKLQGILNPSNIEIENNDVYIVEGAKVHIFSLPHLESVRMMGREGDGPGAQSDTLAFQHADPLPQSFRLRQCGQVYSIRQGRPDSKGKATKPGFHSGDSSRGGSGGAKTDR